MTSEPRVIYKQVINETDSILEALKSPSESTELSDAIETARDSFTQMKSETDVVLQELEKNAEWDALTIAFYGETNAGKSTIIETLRILMGEKTKQEQRQRFCQVREKHGIDKDIAETWEQKKREISEYEENLGIVISQFAELLKERKVSEDEILTHIERLTSQYQVLPFWRRMLSFLQEIPEKSELNTANKKLSSLTSETRRLSQEHAQETSGIMARIDSAKIKIAEIEAATKELEPHQDGAIIGDGQSDFTRESTSYEFTANGNKFVLLDVPGIEGKESLVQESIMQAVRKAHAVFYVTRKADPPQKGDEKTGKGTLEKIKEHLGAQTEVWTIFNKSIKSAERLRARQLVDEGESESLEVLDDKMLKQLGKQHYAGSLSVSAYPAFVASTDHFVPSNAKNKDRSKFLAVMDADKILKKTGIQRLAEKIGSEMTESTKEKIRKSNFNKANDAVVQLKKYVSDLNKNTFKPLVTQLEDQAHNSTLQLKSATDSLKHNIESAAKSLISKKKQIARDNIYKRIGSDIDNDLFKSYLSEYIETGADEVEKELPVEIQKQIATFQDEVKDIADQFHEHVQEFIDDASMTGDMSFSLNIKIDNGINITGLIGSAVGAAVLFFSGPPGWVALAVGLVGIAISIYKSVRSWVSSDYKKAQQRKAADENIDKIFDKIESNCNSQLKENMKELAKVLAPIKEKFQRPAQQAELITSLLKDSAQKLESLSRKIVKEGGL